MFGLDDLAASLFATFSMFRQVFRQARKVRSMVRQLLEGEQQESNGIAEKVRRSGANGRRNRTSALYLPLDSVGVEGEEAEPEEQAEEEGDISGLTDKSPAKESRKTVLDRLANEGYTKPLYYKQLSQRSSKKGRITSSVSADSELIAMLDSEDIPKSYHAIDVSLAVLERLSSETELFRNPPKKPDTSKLNYLADWRKIVSGQAHYFSARFRLSMRGKNRTLDVVLDEMVAEIVKLSDHVDTAIQHSARVTDGLAAYQETVIEPRACDAGDEWGKAFNAAKEAAEVLNKIAQYKEGSTPSQYTQFSVAERNLARLRQHSDAKMRESEAVAVHNKQMLAAANNLEGNIRTGLLELETLSTLVKQTAQDIQYTTHGTRLLRHGYQGVAAIGRAAATLRDVMDVRLKEISVAVNAFNKNLDDAQQKVNAKEGAEGAYENKPEIALGVGYEQTHEEALRIFAERGIAPAKRMLYKAAANSAT